MPPLLLPHRTVTTFRRAFILTSSKLAPAQGAIDLKLALQFGKDLANYCAFVGNSFSNGKTGRALTPSLSEV
jgi:hypothetical protein